MFNGLDMGRLAAPLARARYEQGRLAGRADALDAASRREVVLMTLAEDVVASAALEGRSLDPGRVRAAIAGRLGGAPDFPLDGLAEIALDAARDPAAPLTRDRLGAWHAALGTPGSRRVRRGRAEGTEAFLAWFEDARGAEPTIAAGLAHLRFLALSPFENGNGPIARAVADLALAGAEASGVRFYSPGARIARERRAYGRAIEAALAGGTGATEWLEWFLLCLARASADAHRALAGPAGEAAPAAADAGDGLNPRQRTVLDRLRTGVPAGIGSSRWAAMTGCSRETAIRDINELVARGILTRSEAGGRSTSYALAEGRDG